jgi:NitT/TauT family transport system permease protein
VSLTDPEGVEVVGGDVPAAAPERRIPVKARLAGVRRSRSLVMFVASILLAAGTWTLLSMASPRLVPGIAQVIDSAREYASTGSLWQDILASVGRVVNGFLIGSVAGVVVGVLIGWYRFIRELTEPWIQFLRMIPPLAIVPIVIVYLGIGESAKIFVIALGVFLTVVIAAYQGVLEVDPILLRAARSLSATDRQIFVSVVLPGSLPYILVGLRLGLGVSWTTVVAAELIAAKSGLGYLVSISSSYLDMAGAYLAVICIGALGLIMDFMIGYLQRRFAPWG